MGGSLLSKINLAKMDLTKLEGRRCIRTLVHLSPSFCLRYFVEDSKLWGQGFESHEDIFSRKYWFVRRQWHTE